MFVVERELLKRGEIKNTLTILDTESKCCYKEDVAQERSAQGRECFSKITNKILPTEHSGAQNYKRRTKRDISFHK